MTPEEIDQWAEQTREQIREKVIETGIMSTGAILMANDRGPHSVWLPHAPASKLDDFLIENVILAIQHFQAIGVILFRHLNRDNANAILTAYDRAGLPHSQVMIAEFAKVGGATIVLDYESAEDLAEMVGLKFIK